MKKTFFLIILCLLTLVACQINDEPSPKNTKPCVIVLHHVYGQSDQILTLDGDTIYTATKGCKILKIAADGVDWYAAIKDRDKYLILKNGETVCMTDNIIMELEAYDHHYYTLQKEFIPDDWPNYYVFKDQSHQYDLLEIDYTSMRINEPIADSGNNHAEVIIEGTPYEYMIHEGLFYTGKGIFVDGEYPELPYVNQGVIVHCDYVHGDLAFCYNNQTTGKAMYYYKGQTYEIPDDQLTMIWIRLVNGTPYIFGMSNNGSIVVYAGTQRVAVLEENYIMKSILHNNDIYVLYDAGEKCHIYKNNKRLEQVDAIYKIQDFAILNIPK